MEDATIRELLETYMTTAFGSNGVYLVAVTLGLIAFWFFKALYNWALRRIFAGPMRSNAEFERRFDARTVDIPPVNIPTAARPQDNRYFQTVLTFVQSKMAQGQALVPQERFVWAEIAFLEKVFVSGGLSHFDSFVDGLPYKGFELRRALEEIGATDLAEIIERAVATYLHRQQLLTDIMALGASRADALLHSSLPSYAPLVTDIDRIGGAAYFVKCADAYFERTYPWSDAAS